jgi:hypothetical protein
MTADKNQNRCYTEDTDTAAAIIALLRYHDPAQWPVTGHGALAYVKPPPDGLDDLLKPISLQTELEVSGRRAFAIVMDAETKPSGPWQRVKAFADAAKPKFKSVPATMPVGGLCLENENGVRFGLWIMPDNSSTGMLEDWLKLLVPNEQAKLWDHAVDATKAAREKFNSGCKDVHLPKAHLHTMLAWRDPPGQRIGSAISDKILDPAAEAAKPFLKWFKEVFQV